jgi:hypothetical protein
MTLKIRETREDSPDRGERFWECDSNPEHIEKARQMPGQAQVNGHSPTKRGNRRGIPNLPRSHTPAIRRVPPTQSWRVHEPEVVLLALLVSALRQPSTLTIAFDVTSVSPQREPSFKTTTPQLRTHDATTGCDADSDTARGRNARRRRNSPTVHR